MSEGVDDLDRAREKRLVDEEKAISKQMFEALSAKVIGDVDNQWAFRDGEPENVTWYKERRRGRYGVKR